MKIICPKCWSEYVKWDDDGIYECFDCGYIFTEKEILDDNPIDDIGDLDYPEEIN